MCIAFVILGAYNNAGLVPMANVIAPGLPAPPPYTANQAVSGKACISFKNIHVGFPGSLLGVDHSLLEFHLPFNNSLLFSV